MIDLHMHTINSDGSDTALEIIEKCEKLKLEYISITDHDNCRAYNDIKDVNINKIFSGKIIPGSEFTTTYKGRTIEVLGYYIDTDYINKWNLEYYNTQIIAKRKKYCLDKAIENLEKLGINIDKEKIDRRYSYNRAIYMLLVQNKEENEKVLGKDMLSSVGFLFRNGFTNPESPLFIDVSAYRPSPKQITDLIHKSGGIAFLAHPYQYPFSNTLEMIDELRKECDLDGVEAYHSSFTIDQMLTLEEYAKKNKLYISGGSDYHGKIKPEISLKTGCCNLHISKNILEWLR